MSTDVLFVLQFLIYTLICDSCHLVVADNDYPSLLHHISCVRGGIHVGLQDEHGFKIAHKTVVDRISDNKLATECTVFYALLDSVLWIGLPI